MVKRFVALLASTLVPYNQVIFVVAVAVPRQVTTIINNRLVNHPRGYWVVNLSP